MNPLIQQRLRQRVIDEINSKYTPQMRQIEDRTGRSLVELLAPHRLSSEIENELGIAQSTVSKYRRILGIVSLYPGRPRGG